MMNRGKKSVCLTTEIFPLFWCGQTKTSPVHLFFFLEEGGEKRKYHEKKR